MMPANIPATHGKPVYKTLEEAIHVDDAEALEDMIRNGASINSMDDKHKFTPLHWASFYGALQCTHWLLWNGADHTAATAKGWSPVHIAAIRGQDACIQALLNNNASVNARDTKGSTAGHLATTHGKSFTLQHILRAGLEIEAQDSNGWTALMCAAFHGRLGCLQLMVKWGGRLDDTDTTGNTAAHLAAMEGHVHCLRYIISQAGNAQVVLQARNDDGETPRALAERFYKDNIIEFLNNFENEVQQPEPAENMTFPAHVAAYKGDLEALKMLVENGAVNINERDDKSSTPAHKAAGQGHLKLLRWLIETGCDLNIKNQAGETPKDVARRFAQLGALRLMGVEGTVDSDEDAGDAGGNETGRASSRADSAVAAAEGEGGPGVRLGAEDRKRARARAKKKIEDMERMIDIAKKNYVQLGGQLKEEKELEVQRGLEDVALLTEGGDEFDTNAQMARMVTQLQQELEAERQRRERLEPQLDAYRREIAKLRVQREQLREETKNMRDELTELKATSNPRKKRSGGKKKSSSSASAAELMTGVRVRTATTDAGISKSYAIV